MQFVSWHIRGVERDKVGPGQGASTIRSEGEQGERRSGMSSNTRASEVQSNTLSTKGTGLPF